MFLVQLILGLALFICLIIAVIVFINLLKNKEGKRVFLQLLGIESVVFIFILLLLQSFLKESFGLIITMSFIYTLLANIPIAIIAKVIEVIIRKRQVTPK